MLKFLIFLNRLTNWFDWFIRVVRIQHCFFGWFWRALLLVLIISPSSEPGIVHHFFVGLLILQGTFYQNFIIFLKQVYWLAFGSTS